MKKLINLFILVICMATPALTQVDRTKVPKAGPAPEIKIGDFKSFTLPNGLKVFVVENHRLPLVSYSITFVNTPVLEKEFSGYSQFTGELLGTATKTKTKEQINDEIDFLGASFNASATGISASSLKKHTSQLLAIVSDILLNPVFKQEELEKIRTKTLSAIAANKNDPNAIASDVISVLNFGSSHPYGEILTEASAKNITLEKCEEYYGTYFRPNVAYLSIVGDITLAEAKPLIEKYFSKWTKKDVPDYSYKKPEPPANRHVAIVNRDASVQSVINVGYAVDLTLANPDYLKARVANTILGGGTYRLFNNLREKHGYTYGAYSSIRSMPLVGSFVASTNVANEVTDSSIFQILYEMNRMRNEPVPADELNRVKNYMTGNFALSLEDPKTIAGFAINTERYKLPKDFYKNYLKNLAAVTSADVQAMSQKYILPERCNILVVGKASEIAGKLSQFGPVKYYTDEGMQYDPVAGVPVLPDTLRAQHVLDRYIEAIGGSSKVSQVKDMRQTGSISVQGMTISLSMAQKFPDKALTEIKMGDNLLNKSVLFGSSATSAGAQGNQSLTGVSLDLMKMQALIFPEDKLEQFGFNATLKGVEKVEGKNNYVIEIATPSGGKVTDYFDMETGLRTKTLVVLEGPDGNISQETKITEYTEANGIKVAKKIKQSAGPQSFDIIIDNIEINANLSDEIFK